MQMRGESRQHGEERVPFLKKARLLTDGGEDSEKSSDESASAEEESTAEEEGGNEEGSSEDEESEEGDEADEEESRDEEGTTVLYLDLEGLFLNLLGLEVDLNEVELDISAMPRPGGLLGNLLSGVAGLLDKNPLGSLSDALPDFSLPSVSDMLPEGGNFSEMGYRVLNELLDMLLDTLDEDESSNEEASES